MATPDVLIIRLSLAIVWLASGSLSFGIYPIQNSLELLSRIGLNGTSALATLYVAAMTDIALGLMTLFKHGRSLWLLQAGLIVVYTLILSIWLPEFWLHPFGPILKNLPILTLLWLLYMNEGARP